MNPKNHSQHRPRLLFSIVLVAISLVSVTQSPAQVSITPLSGFGGADGWLTPGEGGYTYLGTSSLDPGMAYGNNHLYLVSRNGGDNIRILDKLTGADLGSLPLGSGIISGGTFTVNTVGVGQDGAIYVANLCNPVNGSTPFKIYRWADESSTPTVAFSSTNITAGQLGTDLDVFGGGAATRLIAGEYTGGGSGLRNSFALLATTDGLSFNGSLTPFVATQPTAGDFALGLTFLDSTHVFGAKKSVAPNDPVRYVSIAAPLATITGQWDFDAGNLSATIGNPLQYRGTTAGLTQFGTTTSFGIADIGGQAANVMRFPACSSSQGYLVPHGGSPNASPSGTKVNQYTVIMDILFPSTSTGFRSLWQTETNNPLTTDGDFFVNGANAIGISGQYQGNLTPNVWHRVAFTVDPTTREMGKYIDGTNVLTGPVGVAPLGSKPMQYLPTAEAVADGRWALGPLAMLFADESNETGVGYVNSIQFQDRVLSAAEIAALGGPSASGIPNATPATPTGIGKILATPVLATSSDAPMDYAVVNGLPLLATVSLTDSRVRVYDASNPINLSLLATSSATLANLNSSDAGAVAWGDQVDNGDGTHTAFLYAMNANNGIQAFTVIVGPCTPSTLTLFSVTGGGTQCGGATVGLSGSQTGVAYLLRTNSVYAGIAMEGTGSAISFGNQPVTASYTVLASNTTYGCTKLMSGSASVTVIIPPAITSGSIPATFTNYQGGYLSFAVTATGSPLTYQWRRDGTNLANGGRISGATSPTLTIYPADPADSVGAGHGYTCMVSNGCVVFSTESTAAIIPFVAVPETVAGGWTNRYDGPTNRGDSARAVSIDTSGNVVVTGSSDVGGNGMWHTVKYAADGMLGWAITNAPGEGNAIAVDSTGNVIVTGDSNADFFTAKYAAGDGALLWAKQFGGPAGRRDTPTALAVDGNGDVIVTGSSENALWEDYYTAKYAAADGALIWEVRYNSPANFTDIPRAIGLDASGNVFVTGESDLDYYTAKYAAADGSLLWEKRYNPSGGVSQAWALAVDSNGDVVVTGRSDDQYCTLKYATTDGALLWEKHSAIGAVAEAYAVAADQTGNVMVTGIVTDSFVTYDFYTAKYSSADGSLLWQKRGPVAGDNLVGALNQDGTVAVDNHGNAVVTGYSYNGSNYDLYTMKYAGENGTLLWSARYNGIANGDDLTATKNPLAIGPSGEVVVAGTSDSNPTAASQIDYVTIKYIFTTPSNSRPFLSNPIPDTNGIYGTPFNFTFAADTFSEPDAGQTLTYSASGLPSGITFTPGSRTFSGAPTVVGTSSVTVTATDNGSPTLSTNDVFDIVIAKAPLTATADNQSRTYAETNPPLTLSYSAFMLGENASVIDTPPIASTLATNGSPVSPYPITVGGGADDHYELSYVTGTLNIMPSPLAVTPDNTNRIYGELNPAFTGTVIGVANGDNITATYGITADTNSPPGTYPIQPVIVDPDTKLANYTVTTNIGTLTVTAAPLTVTANDTNRVYGTANPEFTGLLLGVVNGDNITATFFTAATIADPPGTYPITPVLSDPAGKLGNYAVTANTGTLTILSPPELTFTLGGGGGGLFTLSWPSSYAGFILESTESLAPPVVWQEVTSGITESGGIKSYTVTNELNVAGRLYRLRLP